MTNRDVLNRKHPQEIEQMLGFLLMEYWDKVKVKLNIEEHISSPINIVSVYKEFLLQETIIDTELYDKMYPKETDTVIDADFVEIEDTKETISLKPDKIMHLIDKYAEKHDLVNTCAGEYIYQSDEAQVDAIDLVSNIFDIYNE